MHLLILTVSISAFWISHIPTHIATSLSRSVRPCRMRSSQAAVHCKGLAVA